MNREVKFQFFVGRFVKYPARIEQWRHSFELSGDEKKRDEPQSFKGEREGEDSAAR